MGSKRQSRTRYDENHKSIDGIEYKLCRSCNNWIPMTNEYYYKNKSSKVDGFNSYCKKCSIKKSNEYKQANYEKCTANIKRWLKENELKNRETKRRWELKNSDKRKEEIKQWRTDNKQRIKEYIEERIYHKKHNISESEKMNCKKYFNYSCAYCGITEIEHKAIYKQQLHMDHVDFQGANDLSNNVPCCKSCNSKKRDHNINFFAYAEDINVDRLQLVLKWIKEDYRENLDKM